MGGQRGRVGGVVVDVLLFLICVGGGLARDASRIPGWPALTGSTIPPPEYLTQPSPAVIVGAHVLGGVLLLGRRHRPYLVAVVLGAISLVVPLISAVFVLYAVARHGGRPGPVVVTNLAVVLAMLAGGNLLTVMGSTDFRRGDPYSIVLVGVALTALGLYVRARQQLLAALLERAERAEREAATQAELARLRERAELAVHLHDDISHQLTVVTMGAGALARTSPDPDSRREAEEVRRGGEHALTALHQMIRALTGTPSPPQPGALPEARPGPSRAFVLQALTEALVNADKHAPGAPVTVHLQEEPDGTELTVTSGHARAATDAPSSGLGLASLRERCTELGGTLDAGPGPDGGWVLRVRLPARHPAAEPVR